MRWRKFLPSILRKGRKKPPSDYLSGSSRSLSAAHDNILDSPPSKEESSHTAVKVVNADSVQTPLVETAPRESHNSGHDLSRVSLSPVSVHQSQDPDTGRCLITFGFYADDLLDVFFSL